MLAVFALLLTSPSSRFTDFAHATSCEQRSLKRNQEVALQGQFAHKPGMLRFYDELNKDELSKDELRRELEARGVKDYPTTRKGRIDTLKCILCGVQRVPSLLMFSPESALGDLNLQDYEGLPFEPLHDLKGYLGSVPCTNCAETGPVVNSRIVNTYTGHRWRGTRSRRSIRVILPNKRFFFQNHPILEIHQHPCVCSVLLTVLVMSCDVMGKSHDINCGSQTNTHILLV